MRADAIIVFLITNIFICYSAFKKEIISVIVISIFNFLLTILFIEGVL